MTSDLLAGSGPHWTRAAPASPSALEALRSTYPSLPSDYISLLGQSNGGEGELGIDPGWFQLWPAEAVASLNEGYELSSALPGWVGIGSSGGGECIAVAPDGRIFMVPFIPLTTEEALCIAATVAAFAASFGHPSDAA